MSTKKPGIKPGVYDNLSTARREEYDEDGCLVRSAGIVWLANNRHKEYARLEFGSLRDVPERFKK